MSSSAARRVVVVGAGLAGLAAAYRLERLGAQVTVVEARARAGGRVATDVLEGLEIEPALPVIPERAPELFGLVRELGLSKSVRRTAIERVVTLHWSNFRPIDLRGRASPGSGLPVFSFLRRRRLRRLMRWYSGWLDPRVPEHGSRLDDRSARGWSELYLGARPSARIYGPMLDAHYGLDDAETSRLLLLLLLDERGHPALSIVRGLGQLSGQLAGRLRDLRTSEIVKSVLPGGHGVKLDSGEDIYASAVIVATPAHTVPELVRELLPVEQEFYARIRYVDRMVLGVVVRGFPTAGAPVTWVPSLVPGPLAAVVDASSHRQRNPVGDARVLLLVARRAWAAEHSESSDEEVAEALLEAAEELRPGLARHSRGRRLYRLIAQVPRFDVGHFQALARVRQGVARDAPDRAIAFCGDYLVGPHAEGVVASATRAVEQLFSG